MFPLSLVQFLVVVFLTLFDFHDLSRTRLACHSIGYSLSDISPGSAIFTIPLVTSMHDHFHGFDDVIPQMSGDYIDTIHGRCG